ncbi:MAG: hypothetical protein LBU36_05455 [Clostridiales bacterium]|nr:hypothetical protein [Clostridiales bacterium]
MPSYKSEVDWMKERPFFRFQNVYLSGAPKEDFKGRNMLYRGLHYSGHFYTLSGTYFVCICDCCEKSFTLISLSPNDDPNKNYDTSKSLCCPHCGAVYVDYENHPAYRIEGRDLYDQSNEPFLYNYYLI